MKGMNANRSRGLLLAAILVSPLAYVVIAMPRGRSFDLRGTQLVLTVVIVFCAWLVGLWLFHRGMKRERDNWGQIRLSNVLISMALFGVALALWIGHPIDTPDASHSSHLPLAAALTLFGTAGGSVFGRYGRGALVGLAAFGLLWIWILAWIPFVAV